MSQLFRSNRSDPARHAGLDRELQSLEKQATTASPGYETQYLNRAGNLCVEASQPQRALGYFGRAIDAYLESGRFSAAEVLCNRVIKIAPEAVRARCTLAWLSIGRGYHGGPNRELDDYVRAARRTGMGSLAAKQLCMMAEAATSTELRERIAEHLLDLGETEEADRVFGMVFSERNGLRSAPVEDEGKLWSQLLRAALMGPQELKEKRVSVGEGAGGDPGLPSLG
jgi:hypothetical protein